MLFCAIVLAEVAWRAQQVTSLIGPQYSSDSFTHPSDDYPYVVFGVLAGTLGAPVALSLGIYGNVHDPTSDLSITLGFKDTITMKVWLASASVLFALFQLFSALWMYGKLPLREGPAWLGPLHRISGRLAFLLTLLTVLGIIAAVYGVQIGMRFYTEEVDYRAEPLLAAALSRAIGLAPRACACARLSTTRKAPSEPSAKPPSGARSHTGRNSPSRQ